MNRLFLVVVIVVAISVSTSAQEKAIHEIHAAMVYNFMKYVQWPDESDGGEFIVGVLGDDNVFNTLKLYDGKSKGSKKIVVKKLGSSAEASSCHVVYLGKAKNKEFEGMKSSVTGKSVLTITDGSGLAEKGSCINFKIIDGKLKFELNQNSVTSSNLKISGQLTSMAILI